MEIKEPARRTPPCATCPYKLGLIRTLVNPCPNCKANNYAAYDRFMGKQAQPRDENPRRPFKL